MALSLSDFRYFVYALTFQDGRVFYIGKGTGSRPNDHIAEAKAFHLCPKCVVIRHIIASGKHVRCVILFETNDLGHALWAEMWAISSVPYGALCNLIGGDRSLSTRVKQSSEFVWDADVLQRQQDGSEKRILSRSGETRIDCQARLVEQYDALVLPKYMERVIYHVDSIEDCE